MAIEEGRVNRRAEVLKNITRSETTKFSFKFIKPDYSYPKNDFVISNGLYDMEQECARILKVDKYSFDKPDISNIDISSFDYGRVLNFGDNFSGLSVAGYMIIDSDITSNKFDIEKIMISYLMDNNLMLAIYINNKIYYGYCVAATFTFIPSLAEELGVALNFICVKEEDL